MSSMDRVAQSPFVFLQVSSDAAQLHLLLDIFQLLLQFFSFQLQLQIAGINQSVVLLRFSQLVDFNYGMLGHREHDVTPSLSKSVNNALVSSLQCCWVLTLLLCSSCLILRQSSVLWVLLLPCFG